MVLRLYIWTCTVCKHRQQMDDDPQCICGEPWHYGGEIEKIRFTSTGSQVNFADCYCDTCCADIGDDAPTTPFGRVRNGQYTGVYGESLRASGKLPPIPAPSQHRYTLPTPRGPGSLQMHPQMYSQPAPRMPRQGYYTMGGRMQEFWNRQLQMMGNGGEAVGEQRQDSTPGYRNNVIPGEPEVLYGSARYVPMQQFAVMQEQGGGYPNLDREQPQQMQGREVERDDEYGQAVRGGEVVQYEDDGEVGSLQEGATGMEVPVTSSPITQPQTQEGPERMKELEGMIWSGALLGITTESLEQRENSDEQQQQDRKQKQRQGHKQQVRKEEH